MSVVMRRPACPRSHVGVGGVFEQGVGVALKPGTKRQPLGPQHQLGLLGEGRAGEVLHLAIILGLLKSDGHGILSQILSEIQSNIIILAFLLGYTGVIDVGLL